MPKATNDKQESRVCTWDFTLFGHPDLPSVDDLKLHLLPHIKKFAFQLEVCPTTGREHYQGRISLKEKHRKGTLLALICTDFFRTAELRITSNENRDNQFYVVKSETRKAGPWTDKDKPRLKSVDKMVTLRPWQSCMIPKLLEYNDRQIDVIIDFAGNTGKTSLKKYLYVHHDAVIVPPQNDMKDIMQWCMSFPPSKLYVIDLPRAMPKKKLMEMYSGIEQLKDGFMYDTRYHGKFSIMDEPQILVLTNCPPKKKYLSLDRWRMWTILNDHLMVYKYDTFEKK